MYLIFGVLTTLVGWIVYFTVFWAWKGIFSVSEGDTTNAMYFVGYTVAQVIQWICAVLFAFFTNRKWVFTSADKNVSIIKQLFVFAGGRLATFGLDYVVTYFGAMALTAIFPALVAFEIFGKSINLNDVISKVIAAIIVIIGNYVFGKIFVFKNKKNNSEPGSEEKNKDE